MSQSEQTNYYEILEVAPDAPNSEIQKAHQRARQTYSQDNPALYSMFSPEEARELLRLIDEAYNVLSNSTSRKNYDDSLSGKAQPAPAQKSPPPPKMSHYQPEPIAEARAATPSSHSTPPPANENSFDTGSGDEFAVRTREAAKPALPAGTGRTQLSTYKLDDSFENEISQSAEFDGGFLQRVRLYKNISIDKMSEATRISRPYLMAVETNDYKSLPAAVFVRGFVVQVARQLGLDETKAAGSYMKLFKAGGGK